MLNRAAWVVAVCLAVVSFAPADEPKPADTKANAKKIEKGAPADALLADSAAR